MRPNLEEAAVPDVEWNLFYGYFKYILFDKCLVSRYVADAMIGVYLVSQVTYFFAVLRYDLF